MWGRGKRLNIVLYSKQGACYTVDYNIYRKLEWNKESGEDMEYTKKTILTILKDQKVSLSKIRTLFDSILIDIEDKNPINY